MDNCWNPSADVEREDIKIVFRCNDNKSDATTISILDFYDLHNVLWYHINRVALSCDNIELSWLYLSTLAFAFFIVVKIEELTVENGDSNRLFMVDAEYKADLLVYIVTIVAGLLAVVAHYAACARAVRIYLDEVLPLISFDSRCFIMDNFDTTIF